MRVAAPVAVRECLVREDPSGMWVGGRETLCGQEDSEKRVAAITADTFKLNFVSGDLTLAFSDTGKTTVPLRKRNVCQQSGECG